MDFYIYWKQNALVWAAHRNMLTIQSPTVYTTDTVSPCSRLCIGHLHLPRKQCSFATFLNKFIMNILCTFNRCCHGRCVARTPDHSSILHLYCKYKIDEAEFLLLSRSRTHTQTHSSRKLHFRWELRPMVSCCNCDGSTVTMRVIPPDFRSLYFHVRFCRSRGHFTFNQSSVQRCKNICLNMNRANKRRETMYKIRQRHSWLCFFVSQISHSIFLTQSCVSTYFK